jgi:plastocyanin
MRRAASRVVIPFALAMAFATIVTQAPPVEGSHAVRQPESAATVEIANFTFSPNPVTIGVGQTVIWISRDSVPHTVTGEGFDTGRLLRDEWAPLTFEWAGEYHYNCAIHPEMAGTVIVQ